MTPLGCLVAVSLTHNSQGVGFSKFAAASSGSESPFARFGTRRQAVTDVTGRVCGASPVPKVSDLRMNRPSSCQLGIFHIMLSWRLMTALQFAVLHHGPGVIDCMPSEALWIFRRGMVWEGVTVLRRVRRNSFEQEGS